MQHNDFRTIALATLALLAPLALAGCTGTSPGDTGGSSGWSVGDSGTDAGPDGGDGIVEEPLSTTFRLENDGARPVRIVPVGPCSEDSNEWISLRKDGSGIDENGSCGICDCSDLRSGGCAVCGAPLCEPNDQSRRIGPGESAEWTWSGQYFERGSVGGETCERAVTPRRGERLTARICWSAPTSSDGSRAPSPDIHTCKTVQFEYGTSNVVHRISPGGDREPQPTEFRLQNDSETTLLLSKRNGCTPSSPSWLQLFDRSTTTGDSATPVDFETSCTVCSCSDARSGVCGACELACPPQELVRLPPGEAKTLQWDGIGHRRLEIDGQTCHEEWTPPAGRGLGAKFCWRTDGPSGPRNCTRVGLEYGATQTVTHTVEPEDVETPAETDFVLRNESDRSVRVESYTHCYASSPEWVTLRRNGSEFDPGIECDECACSQLRAEDSCQRACPAASCVGGEFDLEPGTSRRWTWRGYIAEQNTVDGQQCLERTVPARDSVFTAEICWSVDFGATREERCETREFRYGRTGTVRHAIQ